MFSHSLEATSDLLLDCQDTVPGYLAHVLPAAFSPLQPYGLPAFALSVLRSVNHTLSFSMMMEILGGSLWTQDRDPRATTGVEDSGKDGC